MTPAPTRRLFFFRYLRAHPFSAMALCNILGDSCWVGYAFEAEGFVSWPKLIGACLAFWAHSILLAYGDDRARVIEAEQGHVAALLLSMRNVAQKVNSFLPLSWILLIRKWPVGITFSILSLNGVAFVIDGLTRMRRGVTVAMVDQSIMGILILAGLLCMVAADFVTAQKAADRLTKTASFTLGGASLLGLVLAITTLNPFVWLSVVAFGVSNLTVYFARIDKLNIPLESNV